MLKVLGLGDNVCDLYLHSKRMYPGGQCLNVAVYAKTLGHNAAFLGVFGDDAVADHIVASIDQLGIRRERCRREQGENGFACIRLDDGDRVFVGSNRGGVLQEHPIRLDRDDLAYIAGFDWVHTSNNGFLDDQLPKLRQCPVLVTHDFSGRWNEQDRVERVCPHIDIAFASGGAISREDALEIGRNLIGHGAAAAVVTLGSKGSLLVLGENSYLQAPELVKAVDTLGAGDSFAAAFVCSLMESARADGEAAAPESLFADEQRIWAALAAGARFAAQTCLKQGAFDYGTEIPDHVLKRAERFQF